MEGHGRPHRWCRRAQRVQIGHEEIQKGTKGCREGVKGMQKDTEGIDRAHRT